MLEYPDPFTDSRVRLAFFGPMASGKTFIAENLFPNYHKESLAKPLKDTARFYYNVTGKSNSERQILQELADDLKKWDNNVFTKLLLWRVREYYLTYDGERKHPVIVDDLRFPHEANDLRAYGFQIIRVSVSEDLRLSRIADKYPDTDPARFSHPSETAMKDIMEDIRVSGRDGAGLDFLRRLYGVKQEPSRV